MLRNEFPSAHLHRDGDAEHTAVIEGLRKVAETPSILEKAYFPYTVWLKGDNADRNDDRSGTELKRPSKRRRKTVLADEKDGPHDTVLRIWGRGDPLRGDPTAEGRDNAWPHTYTLTMTASTAGEVLTDQFVAFDNLLCRTPIGISEDPLRGSIPGQYQWAYVTDVEILNAENSEIQLIEYPGRPVHVYCWVWPYHNELRTYLVVAEDGHRIRGLEETRLEKVVADGCLKPGWQSHRQKKLRLFTARIPCGDDVTQLDRFSDGRESL